MFIIHMKFNQLFQFEFCEVDLKYYFSKYKILLSPLVRLCEIDLKYYFSNYKISRGISVRLFEVDQKYYFQNMKFHQVH